MGLPDLPGVDGLGLLVAGLGVVLAIAASLYFKKKPKGCLDPDKFKKFKLMKRTQLSHNTAKFRFALPTPTSVLGLPIGHFIRCRGIDSQGEEVVRPYTPITLDSDIGYFELVVKMYPKGKMSHHFREMREGEYLLAKGPIGRFKYKVGQSRAIGMLAGGSGSTPMFQLARGILENPKDQTSLHLIYANCTFEDILLKTELDTLASKFPNSFTVYYVLSHPPERWNGGSGHITKEMIRDHCPAPANDIQQLKEILAKQAELGCEVAEIPPSSYLSDSEQGNSKEGNRREWGKKGRFRNKFNKTGRSHQDERFTKKQNSGNHDPSDANTDENIMKQQVSNRDHTTRPSMNKKEPTLLQKLLAADLSRDKAHLLQVFRFMVVNSFFKDCPEKPLSFPSIIIKENGAESEVVGQRTYPVENSLNDDDVEDDVADDKGGPNEQAPEEEKIIRAEECFGENKVLGPEKEEEGEIID